MRTRKLPPKRLFSLLTAMRDCPLWCRGRRRSTDLAQCSLPIRPVQASAEGKLMLVDGGRNLCKPIYIDNLVDGLIACVQTDAAVGEAINLSDGICRSRGVNFSAPTSECWASEHLRSVPYRVAWLAACYEEFSALVRGRQPTLKRATVNTFRSRNSFSIKKAEES